jgi:hypothetical protein
MHSGGLVTGLCIVVVQLLVYAQWWFSYWFMHSDGLVAGLCTVVV